MKRLRPCSIILMLWFGATVATAADAGAPREVLSLNGTWSIAEGRMDTVPASFDRTVPVPGLVTLASPAFTPVPGPKVADRKAYPQKDPARDAFWYRRTFRLEQAVPAVARLKVAKAMFGSQVILNGHLLGAHAGSFTPAYYDARAALRRGENVLMIRVGADRDAVTQSVPGGFDYEKERYIPGVHTEIEFQIPNPVAYARIANLDGIAEVFSDFSPVADAAVRLSMAPIEVLACLNGYAAIGLLRTRPRTHAPVPAPEEKPTGLFSRIKSRFV